MGKGEQEATLYGSLCMAIEILIKQIEMRHRSYQV
jgi:hypothetical protein